MPSCTKPHVLWELGCWLGTPPWKSLTGPNHFGHVLWHGPSEADLRDDSIFCQYRPRHTSSKYTIWVCPQVSCRKVGLLSIQLGFGQILLFSLNKVNVSSASCPLEHTHPPLVMMLSGPCQGPPAGNLLLKAGHIFGKFSDEHGSSSFLLKLRAYP